MSQEREANHVKVLIAEDEIYSRRSLIKQLSRYDAGMEIVEASNGRQAWELYQQHKPELVLSDIKMPFMTGLELLKLIMEQHAETKVILISGYAEFQYAQEALNAGAAGYLLKPLSDEALYSCLRKNLQQNTHQKQFEQEMELLKNTDSLSRYIEEGITAGKMKEDYINASLFSHILSPYWVASLLFSADRCPDSSGFHQICKELFRRESCAEYRAAALSRCQWVIVMRAQDGIEQTFLHLSDLLRKQGWKVWIGLNGPQKEPSSLPAAFEEASTAIQYRVLDADAALFSCPALEKQRTVHKAPFRYEDRLFHLLEQHRVSEACDLVTGELARLRSDPHLSLEGCRDFLRQLAAVLEKTAKNASHPAGLSEWTVLPASCETPEALAEAVCQTIALASSLLETSPAGDESSIVERVLAHINQNYNKDISLKELAENIFFMNHTYLSHLIREKTGKNYSSYLRELRIRHAKELLRDPNLSITDVASFSGYNDSSQFIQVFKKEVGITPKKYQEMLRDGSGAELSGKEHQE